MFEVELKARIDDRTAIHKKLDLLKATEPQLYVCDDIYFDKDGLMQQAGQELRIRQKRCITTGKTEIILTFKDSPFEPVSRSKPEYETVLTDFEPAVTVFQKMGYEITVRFLKICTLRSIHYKDTNISVTLAEVPELEQTFLEIETLVADQSETGSAFSLLYEILDLLGIAPEKMTNEYYTEAVKAAR